MRLDKLLTTAGLTRAQAKRAVAEGRARVNGEAVRDAGLRVDGKQVLLDGRPVSEPGEVYWMLNKPAGVLTAVRDAREKTAFALLPEDVRRREPSPIGRLDRDVTGLLLFTTHGELLHRLISPRYAVEKVYIARYSKKVLVMNQSRLFMYADVAEVFEHADQIAAMGLSVPQITRIFHRLSAEGYPVRRNIYDMQRAKDEILRLLSERGKA